MVVARTAEEDAARRGAGAAVARPYGNEEGRGAGLWPVWSTLDVLHNLIHKI